MATARGGLPCLQARSDCVSTAGDFRRPCIGGRSAEQRRFFLYAPREGAADLMVLASGLEPPTY